MSEQDTGLGHAVASDVTRDDFDERFASMAVVAVVLTTAAIAFLGWRFAGLPIALGAIVAPPDAVAANEVLRHLRPQDRARVAGRVASDVTRDDFNENLTFSEAGSSSAAKRCRSQSTRCYGICGFHSGSGPCCRASCIGRHA